MEIAPLLPNLTVKGKGKQLKHVNKGVSVPTNLLAELMNAHQIVIEVLVKLGELQHHVCIAPLELHRDWLLVRPLQHSETLLVATRPKKKKIISFSFTFVLIPCGEFWSSYLGKAAAVADSRVQPAIPKAEHLTIISFKGNDSPGTKHFFSPSFLGGQRHAETFIVFVIIMMPFIYFILLFLE